MNAKEARVISEKFDNSLKDIIFSIKCMAKRGDITATFDKHRKYIGEKELSELQKLGYKILQNDDNYLVVGW